ncbi:NAD(P)H-dependent oxidoreductase [Brevundimonas sp.]|uniref:NAD(P)H-dependent oxidoreductase n=1 Tax=Brevundimonas sp. TaxID=1871086 RepID=UPI002D4A5DD8|nr:NAD(P)H-dependent oxidoreductase [Brevundimonas sp.]HYD27684.1 NAD(P)H-dependent oxidoreductase [Brevundimonas sp.]
MARRILVLDGHPDPDPGRYCHALAAAYAQGGAGAGHLVHRVNLSGMDFPMLTTRQDWDAGTPCPAVLALQEELLWAEHVVIIYPLWLGAMPARLKALFEQVLRPAFAFGGRAVAPGSGRLKGRSVRIIVTMGMPALIYRTVFFSHSLKALKTGILALVGFGPTRETVLGGIESRRDRDRLLKRIREMGARAA